MDQDYHSNSVAIRISPDWKLSENSSVTKDEARKTRSTTPKWPTMDQLVTEDVKLPEPAFLSMWDDKIFVISCAFAILLDPLFSYIYRINDKNKCLMMDQKLKLAYVTLRSATDLLYTLDIIFCLWRIRKAKIRVMRPVSLSEQRSLTPPLLVHIFVALPLPQVTLFTSRNVDSAFLLVAVFQYTVRVYRLYGSVEHKPNIATLQGSWLKATLDFLPFILAAHLYGAVWYYLAVDRIVDCWIDVIGVTGKYEIYCGNSHNLDNNISKINESCSKSSSDGKFGIFDSAIKSGLIESSTDLPQRLLQGFGWGLRNLSSFGSNLNTSLPVLEVIFSICLSISGIVLFLIYFDGRMKVSKKRSKHRKLRRKMKMMTPEIDLWLSQNTLPMNLKTVIVKNVQQKLGKNDVVNTENVLSNLPVRERRDILNHLGMTSLMNVSVFKKMDERVLEEICQRLKLVIYKEDKYIIHEGESLEKMFFVTRGTVWSSTTSSNVVGNSPGDSSVVTYLVRGDLYGEELLNWAIEKFASFSELPISTRTLKTQNKGRRICLEGQRLEECCC